MPNSDVDKTGASRLSEADRRYLAAVVASPGQPSASYARIAQMGTGKATRTRKSLVERGFLREHVVATGRRGRNAIVIEPLAAAHDALGPRSEEA